MKRLFAFLLALLICSSVFPSVRAYELPDETECIVMLEDGSYFTIEIQQLHTKATNHVSGNKAYTFRGSNGEALWKATLHGSFTYNGTSATCTDSSCEVEVYASEWTLASKSAGKSGNQATASVTMSKRILGIVVGSESYSLVLSCDKDGKLS